MWHASGDASVGEMQVLRAVERTIAEAATHVYLGTLRHDALLRFRRVLGHAPVWGIDYQRCSAGDLRAALIPMLRARFHVAPPHAAVLPAVLGSPLEPPGP